MQAAGILLLSALLLSAPARAQLGGDYQAQILYAYQTEDTNGLANLIQELSTQVKADAGDTSLRYHLAHAQYRRGLLDGAAMRSRLRLRFRTVSTSSSPRCRKMSTRRSFWCCSRLATTAWPSIENSNRCCCVRGRRSG